jgi:DNA helicase-2/ATP-dependent DNA helicase PcrA
MSRLLAHLNEPQRTAVTLPPEHALILAGAGSGKTRVLITRIAWLISTGQVNPREVLAVTFTNKAAREMSTRLGALLALETRSMWIGTFHGLCNRLLRAHYREAGLVQSFQILDSADQLAVIKRLLRGLGADDVRFPPRNLQHFINSTKEEGLRASQVETGDDYSRQMAEYYRLYDEQCQREGVVDFAELLLRVDELLARNELLREHYQLRFRHILVDEFQDTNRLQYRLLKRLAGTGSALFAVGDDDQSIYAFRGANVGNMSAFEREFKVHNLIRLEQNYRSHGNILRCANALIANNAHRLGKTLWTDAGHGEPVRIYEAPSDIDEARWLISQVQALIDEGHARSDIAVLYRSNAQSRVLEHALFSAGIAYRVYGGLRFFERAEVKHALAYLRLMENPDDDGAFLRVANFPPRGIGARTIEALQDAARVSGTGLLAAVAGVVGAGGAKLTVFAELLARLRAESADRDLAEIVEQVLSLSGLNAHYSAEREGQDRLENLRELVNAAASFEADPGRGIASEDFAAVAADPGLATEDAGSSAGGAAGEAVAAEAPSRLAEFLAHASLEAGDNQAADAADALQLMTVHSAKGLEFDAVFVTGLEEGLFPHENSLAENDGLEEERRLMYVAITRARQRLHLSFSQTRMLHGQTRYSLQSRFVAELPADALKWLSAKVRAAAAGWQGGAGAAWGGAGRGGARYGVQGQRPPAAQADPATRNFDRGVAYRIGQSVSHAKFGDGVILAIEGTGEDARVQVNFGRAGAKWLALSLAKLRSAG